MNPTVCVTGGSGFVAGHIIRLLLERNYHVRATVRDRADQAKVRPVLDLATGSPGQLELVEADLTVEGTFDSAVRGCQYVIHVASPFLMAEQIQDARRQVIAPAVTGTRSVLAAVDRAGTVDRVVLTSTVGAIFGDYADVLAAPGARLTEDMVNTTSTPEHNPYHYAKTRAEQAAWQWAGNQRRTSLVTVNPGLVLGPTAATSTVSGSLFLMDELFRGQFFYGAANFSFTVVDVRDVAAAHVAALENPAAHGRYILAHEQMVSLRAISRIVRDRHPYRVWLPRHTVPDAAVRRIAPHFGLSPRYVAGHLGITFTVDNRRSIEELGIAYRPVEGTVLDTYDSWLARRRGSVG